MSNKQLDFCNNEIKRKSKILKNYIKIVQKSLKNCQKLKKPIKIVKNLKIIFNKLHKKYFNYLIFACKFKIEIKKSHFKQKINKKYSKINKKLKIF